MREGVAGWGGHHSRVGERRQLPCNTVALSQRMSLEASRSCSCSMNLASAGDRATGSEDVAAPSEGPALMDGAVGVGEGAAKVGNGAATGQRGSRRRTREYATEEAIGERAADEWRI